jgi:AraC family transcriptional regulator
MKSVVSGKSAEIHRLLHSQYPLDISSRELVWNGFAIEGYRGEPGEQAESVHPRHILGLWHGQTATGEVPNGRGGYTRYARYPGRVTFIPPSIIPAFRAHNSFQVVLCLLDAAFVNGVHDELDQTLTEELHGQVNMDDPPLRQLITLLAVEAGQGGMMGHLYADHLAHSIAIRLFSLGTAKKQRARPGASGLPRHLLARVTERMHDLNSNPDLQSLAAETGYSRSHFLRLFRAATGCAPHHYLLQLRLKRAQELMRQKRTSLIDIAAACGFSSHAHMSRLFRQMIGLTPTDYRRNL